MDEERLALECKFVCLFVYLSIYLSIKNFLLSHRGNQRWHRKSKKKSAQKRYSSIKRIRSKYFFAAWLIDLIVFFLNWGLNKVKQGRKRSLRVKIEKHSGIS